MIGIVRKLLILAIFIFSLFTVYSQQTVTKGYIQLRSLPIYYIKEATIFDKILCTLGIKECVEVVKLDIVSFEGIEKEDNKTILLRFKAKPKIIQVAINKNIVKSAIDFGQVYFRVSPSTFVGYDPINNAHFLKLSCTDCYSLDQYPTEFKFSMTAYNYIQTMEVSLLILYFTDGITDVGVVIDVDPPYVWRFAGNFWTVIDILDYYEFMFANVLEFMYYYDGCKMAGLYKIRIFTNITDILCSANPAESYRCNVSVVRTVNICGRTVNVLRASYGTPDITYRGYPAVMYTDVKLIRLFIGGESCGLQGVAYDHDSWNPYNATELTYVAQCYQCPPNSLNPGGVIYDGVIPYCECIFGYENRDVPVDGSTKFAYIIDPNGCEFKIPNCPAEVTINPPSKEVAKGETAYYTIDIKNTGLDECTYTLSANCPAELSCSLSKTSVTLAGGTSTAATLAVDTSNAQIKTYTVSVTVKDPIDNTYTASATLIVTQPPANCAVSVSISPSTQTINPGQTASYTVTIYNNGNTQCTYSLTADCPTGVSCQLSQTSITVNSGSSKTVTLTATSNNPGTYTLKVTASSTSPATGSSDTASATLTVETLRCDVQLTTDSTVKTIAPGQTAQYSITVKNTGNTQCTFTLSADCPTGVSCSLSKTSVTLNAGQSDTVTLTASSNIEGNYTLKVTASNTEYQVSKSITLTLQVIAGANPPEVTVSPSSVKLREGESTNVIVTVKNTGTSTATYTISIDCPTGLTCVIDRKTVTLNAGQDTQLFLSISAKQEGNYTVIITATGDKGEKDSATLYVKVEPKRQQPIPENKTAIPYIFISPSEVSIKPGEKAEVTIRIRNVGNKEGEFTIDISCPEELICELSKDKVTIKPKDEKEVTLTISGETPGRYTVMIEVTADGNKDYGRVVVEIIEVMPEYIKWVAVAVAIAILIILIVLFAR